LQAKLGNHKLLVTGETCPICGKGPFERLGIHLATMHKKQSKALETHLATHKNHAALTLRGHRAAKENHGDNSSGLVPQGEQEQTLERFSFSVGHTTATCEQVIARAAERDEVDLGLLSRWVITVLSAPTLRSRHRGLR
jgi:hypothetical protein